MRLATDLRRTSAVRGFLARYFADEDGGRVRPLAEYQSDAPAFADEIAEAYGYLAAGETEVQERQQIGPLRLLCEVGRGGQARVFLAEDERWERRVAVKLLDGPVSGQAMQRFRREAELASRLQHPAVCPVFDLGVDGDTPYLVMPFLAGRTLAEILVEEERVEVDRAVAWAEQLARGLHVAHEAGIVHRDVKPANVLVRPDGTPVLMDFGVARDASEQAAALTETGEAVGTPAYMAPEQVLGQTTGAETDVYALAATLYESLTGRPPFQAPTRHALFSAVLSQLVPDARRLRPEVGRDLWVVLETALAKQPAQRFSSAAELAEELQRVRERRPILSRPAGPGMRLMRWTQRSPGLAAGVLGSFAVLLTGLALTLVLLGRVEDERDEKRAALDEVEMLADRTRMEQLRDEIPRFEPPREEDLPEIEAWLERADELEGRLGEHRSILAGYRARSLPRTPEHEASDRALHELAPELERRIRNRDFVVEGHIKPLEEHGESEEETGDLEYYRQQLRDLDETIAQLEAEVSAHRTYRFVRAEDQWRHDLRAALVDELERFLTGDRFGSTRARMRALHEEANTLRERSIDEHDDAWAETIDDVADEDAYPDYRGLALAPQLGLVPLGPDPGSGLFEFAHLSSGAIAERDPATGRLVVAEETGLVFVLLPGGRTRLGAEPPSEERPLGEPHVDPGAFGYDQPVHEVELAPFFLSKYEMTQGQWLRLSGANPSVGAAGVQYEGSEPIDLRHPVEAVTWYECDALMQRLGLMLPTSAQWEYAARGGTTTPFFTGELPESLRGYANCADIALARRHNRKPSAEELSLGDDGWDGHAPVGTFLPNPFGFHDMAGNIFEWCRDVDHLYKVPWQAGDAERLAGNTTMRLIRGGAALAATRYARSADRTAFTPDSRDHNTGFRPGRVVSR